MEEKRASLQLVREEMLTSMNTLNNEKIQTEQGQIKLLGNVQSEL